MAAAAAMLPKNVSEHSPTTTAKHPASSLGMFLLLLLASRLRNRRDRIIRDSPFKTKHSLWRYTESYQRLELRARRRMRESASQRVNESAITNHPTSDNKPSNQPTIFSPQPESAIPPTPLSACARKCRSPRAGLCPTPGGGRRCCRSRDKSAGA